MRETYTRRLLHKQIVDLDQLGLMGGGLGGGALLID